MVIKSCGCTKHVGAHKRIVITGGPGAGKTALLEIARKNLCEHVAILPEAATIIFSGGFMRSDSIPSKKAAQRAIFYVQRELENMVQDEGKSSVALCDRGTLDSLAYWPSTEDEFWKEVDSTKEKELAKYAVIIHLRTPIAEHGYNNINPVRIETAIQAHAIDERIAAVWKDHPRRFFVNSGEDFIVKISHAMKLLTEEIPECCLTH
jgi:predicted ATPase